VGASLPRADGIGRMSPMYERTYKERGRFLIYTIVQAYSRAMEQPHYQCADLGYLRKGP
jgi:hypothetical protein